MSCLKELLDPKEHRAILSSRGILTDRGKRQKLNSDTLKLSNLMDSNRGTHGCQCPTLTESSTLRERCIWEETTCSSNHPTSGTFRTISKTSQTRTSWSGELRKWLWTEDSEANYLCNTIRLTLKMLTQLSWSATKQVSLQPRTLRSRQSVPSCCIGNVNHSYWSKWGKTRVWKWRLVPS